MAKASCSRCIDILKRHIEFKRLTVEPADEVWYTESAWNSMFKSLGIE